MKSKKYTYSGNNKVTVIFRPTFIFQYCGDKVREMAREICLLIHLLVSIY